MRKVIDLYGFNEFNPGQIKMDGYSGVIFKAGQGAWADVPRTHPEWWQQAKDFGLLRGWYWLCDSRYHSSAHIDEMNKFKIFDDVGELGLWIDVEKPVISMTETDYWKTRYAGHQNLVDFAYLITLQGITPGIYTGPGAYSLVARDAPKQTHDYLAQFPLWTAQYPFNYQEGISKPSLYGSWKTWTLWQWREGPDVNIFNGTDEEFDARFGVVSTPPTGDPSMYQGTVTTSQLNIRPGASTAQASIGKLNYGDKIEASVVETGWWKLTKITRGTTNMPLPAEICYAYEGATKGYIRTDAIVEPPVDPAGYPNKIKITLPNEDGTWQYPQEYTKVP